MQLLALCATTRQFFLFGILYSLIIGFDIVRTKFTLGSEILGANLKSIMQFQYCGM
jgi:hypothetical protein